MFQVIFLFVKSFVKFCHTCNVKNYTFLQHFINFKSVCYMWSLMMQLFFYYLLIKCLISVLHNHCRKTTFTLFFGSKYSFLLFYRPILYYESILFNLQIILLLKTHFVTSILFLVLSYWSAMKLHSSLVLLCCWQWDYLTSHGFNGSCAVWLKRAHLC